MFREPEDDQVFWPVVAWVAVDVAPVRKLKNPVKHAQIKAEPSLAQMALIRLSRLSVQPVTEAEWEKILAMAVER